jgi:hypothetical protein
VAHNNVVDVGIVTIIHSIIATIRRTLLDGMRHLMFGTISFASIMRDEERNERKI